MRKHRLDLEGLQVESLVTDSVEVSHGPLLSVYTGRYTERQTVIEPVFTNACIPSRESCNCYTDPWC